jgi:post-segregation antitoxin (ccd killing protein)
VGENKKKLDWPALLEAADLGQTRFAKELNLRYGSEKTEFYQGEEVATVKDNATRMRATELHANVLGITKTSLDVSGTIGVSVAAEMSPEERRKWIDEHFDQIAKARGWKPPDELQPY